MARDKSKPYGYIKLHRSIGRCEVLFDEPNMVYHRKEAWVDIILNLASGVDTDNLKRGEFMASLRFLAKRWNWSKRKVERFLADLMDAKDANGTPDPMIKLRNIGGEKAGHRARRFIVCKYGTYNDLGDARRDKLNKRINKEINNNTKNIMSIPLKSGDEFTLDAELLDAFKNAYPGLDVLNQLNRYKAWTLSNPQKRKTSSGILRSINFWLNKEWEKAGNARKLSDAMSEVFSGGRVPVSEESGSLLIDK